jgi:hypothetical protein
MNAKKIILGAAALAVGAFLSAQTVSFHGYLDYTNFAVGQAFNNSSTSNSWTYTEPSAEFGSFYNGRTELNMNVTAANFLFNFGVRFDAGGNSWYDSYYDFATSTPTVTPIHQMNMRVSFLNDQLFVYTGRFEEWNNGYLFDGYQLGGQPVLELASRDAGQYLTAVEFCPQLVNGLKLMAGLPILPGYGNGLQYSTTNQWKNLYAKAKFAAQYKLPVGVTLNALWRPGTYYAGRYAIYEIDSAYSTNYFGEGTLQADMPYLIAGVPLNATFDIRYRKNDTVDKEVFAYYLGLSGRVKPVSNLTINFENRAAYADDHYVATNEKLFYDAVGIGAAYTFSGTPYVIGINLLGTYAQDANGTSYTDGDGQLSTRGYLCADYNMTSDWLTSAASAGSDAPGRYIGIFGYPYFQKNFANGYFQIGVECQYTNYHVTKTTENITYRVPAHFCFWF